MGETIRIEGHIPGEQARRDPYVYLPFAVPAGTTRITVAYSYSDPNVAAFGPGNSVDIGIFDPRGYEFLTAPGFRGWSGTARREFFIAEDDASPGYIAGPIFPGEWNIVLGLARLDAGGVRYDVEVSLEGDRRPGAPAEVSTEVRGTANTAARPRGPARWLRGDLHCHTVHSDGANPVEEVVQHAISLGLDFLAVTDHNTNTHHADLDRLSGLPITLIPGEEVTTYWGHANTWGLREWIDFRCADDASMNAVLQYVRRRDALFSINHAKCIGPPWLFRGWEGYQCMEVWQAPWRFYNWEPLEKWDALLRGGERVVAVGGSDAHSVPPAAPRHPHGLAEPTTWVYTDDPSAAGILAAIRAGRVFVGDSPGGAQLTLIADTDGDGRFETLTGGSVPVTEKSVRFRAHAIGAMDRRLWIVADGTPLDIVEFDRPEATFDFALDVTKHSYVRAELRGYRGSPRRGEVVWAMTNPIWFGQSS